MRFYGHGMVWDKENDKPLIKFINGEYDTDNERIIDILEPLFKHDGEKAVNVTFKEVPKDPPKAAPKVAPKPRSKK